MPGRVREMEARTRAVLVMLPVPLRRAVERLADAEAVSLSEVGRRAIARYVAAQEATGKGPAEVGGGT